MAFPGFDVFTEGGAVAPSSSSAARGGEVNNGGITFGAFGSGASDNQVLYVAGAVVLAIAAAYYFGKK